jgi:hypothetical protein
MLSIIKKLGSAYIMFGIGTVFGAIIASLTAFTIYGPADDVLINSIIENCAPKNTLTDPNYHTSLLDKTSEIEKAVLSYTQP